MSKKTKGSRKVEVGRETYMNTETGELMEVPKFVIEGGDINFEKVWVWHLCDAYKLVGNKSVEVLNYLMAGRDTNNLVMASQRKMADELGVATSTIAKIMGKLRRNNIISMPQQGVYRLNPEVMWRGSHKGRMQVLYEYRAEKKAEEKPTVKQVRQGILTELNVLSERLLQLNQKLELLNDNELTEEAAAE